MGREGVSPPPSDLWRGLGEAWTALATLIGGVAVWGGIGYAVDHWLGTHPVLFVIGALVGNFGGVYLLYVRYLRTGESSDAS